jgi:hypothetical protein
MNMPNYAIWFGRLLVLVGVIGYGYGMFNGNASITALIPAFFGLVLMLLGHVSNSRESLRKHLMHVAILIGLLGFALPAWRLLSRASEFTVSAASLSQIAMSLVCLMFVVLGVRSFINARRAG